MDRQAKKQWVKALRSGEYKQARHRLYNQNTNGFCCLGVLCDVLGWEWYTDSDFYKSDDAKPLILGRSAVSEFENVGVRYRNDLGNWMFEFEELPMPLRDTLGIDRDLVHILTTMNDDNKKTFEEIADWIEENL